MQEQTGFRAAQFDPATGVVMIGPVVDDGKPWDEPRTDAEVAAALKAAEVESK